MKKRTLAFIGLAFAILGGIWWFNQNRPSLALHALPQRASNMAIYSTGSQAPPTNKWFSSLAFKSPSEPVFAYPLAFKTASEGLEISYLQVSSNADTILAPFRSDISVKFGAHTESRVKSYDDLSVQLELQNQGRKVAEARLTQGSPYLFMTIQPHTEFSLSLDVQPQTTNNYVLTSSSGQSYSIFTDAILNAKTFKTGEKPAEFALYLTPDQNHADVYRAGAQNAIVRTEVQYEVTDKQAKTTFVLETKKNEPTPFALLAAQQPVGTFYGSYQTLLGEQTVILVKHHTFTASLPEMPVQLPIEKATEAQRQTLQKTLATEVKSVSFLKNDSYFSGKEFYKVANMLQLAHQLGMNVESKALQSGLKNGLQKWLTRDKATEDGTYFSYDTTLKGVVGVPSAFGSEAFNDHHFHYGYFIYAAAILAQYDSAFLAENKDIVNMLVADIAHTQRQDSRLSYLRVFDQYAGHSWASGLVPFADGNNQESSSEAVHAWYAINLWGKVTGDSKLETTARWLYAREVQAAQQYYLAFNKNRPELANYKHSIITLLWGGKADYATFFSAAPEAKLAIQLLPLNPAGNYVAADKTRAQQNYQAMLAEIGGPPTTFKDYLLMYQALFDQSGAQLAAQTLADQAIDGANSRSYMLAWIFSR